MVRNLPAKEWLRQEISKALLSSNPYGYGQLQKHLKQAGAYAIYIPANGYFYFGSTNHLWRRRIKHIADLRNGVHENRNLQNAFTSSGDNRIIYLYALANEGEDPVDIEQEFITAFWGDSLLCNTGPDARHPTKGVKYSGARIAEISQAMKRRFMNNPEVKEHLSGVAKEQWSNPESRAVMVEKALPNLKLGVEATSLKVIVNDVIYSSISEAGRAHGITATTARYRTKSKHYPHWAMYNENEGLVEAIKGVKMEDNKIGLIIYTDGGSRPNPGRAGYGFHGYLYSTEKPKKGSGNTSWFLTRHGYYPKSGFIQSATMTDEDEPDPYAVEEDEEEIEGKKPAWEAKPKTEKREMRPEEGMEGEVTPIQYVDAFGSFDGDSTNNVAELVAATRALTYACDYACDVITIRTDSRYVCDNLINNVPGWIRNGWRKWDNTIPKNVEAWQKLVEVRNQLKERGTEVQFTWVESHQGIQGNVDADEWATIGVLHARAGIHRHEVMTSVPDGYWKYETGKNPLISLPRCYFNTQAQFNIPGTYFIGNHGKDDEMLGKRISDGACAVLYLQDADPAIEAVRNAVIEDAADTSSLAMIRLDQLYKSNTHKQIVNYGRQAMDRPNKYRLDMETVDKEPLVRQFKPVLIAWRVVEALTFLADQLKQYQAGNPLITATDMTAILYETVVTPSKKKGGEPTTAMQLKADYDVGFAALGVDANYKDEEGDVKATNIILSLGIDLPDRNALNRLAVKNPKVTLLSWQESPCSFRYATVIEASGDVGIYAGVYSNLRILS